MKKLYFLFIISLILLSNLAFGQSDVKNIKKLNPKINGSNGDYQEYFLPLPPLLVDEDSLVSITLYGYSYFDDEISIYDFYWSSEPIISKKTIANEFFQIELPAEKIYNDLIVYSQNPSNVPASKHLDGRCLLIMFEYYENIHIRIKTKYSNYYSNIFNPTYALSKNYKISTYKNPDSLNNSNSFPYANIAGIYDRTRFSFYVGGDSNTIIKMPDGKTYKQGDVIKDSLNRGDFLMITGYGKNTDLSSCMVMANKPVAVYSGNTYTSLGDNYKNQGLLYGNEIPVLNYNTKYYIPPLRNNGNNPILRITARDSANVYAGDSLIGKIKYQFGVKDSAWLEYKIEENKPITIWGDRDIQVMSYSTGIMENQINNPIQTKLIPFLQFNNSTGLFVPDLGIENQKDFASFIMESDTNGNFPDDLSIKVYSKDGSKIAKSIKDFSIINLQEIYDPELINGKKKALSFSIELEKGKLYEIYSREKFRIYANGFNDEFNYLFNNDSQLFDLEKPDTLCPEPHYRLNGSGITYRAETYVVDRPRDDAEVRTNIYLIQFDKNNSYNFTFSNNDFIPGEADSVNWYVDVIDMHQDARAVITFADRAGNDTTITIVYKARKMDMSETHHNFGYVPVGQSKIQKFSMKNEADFDFQFRTISFGRYPYLHERKGFKLNFLFDTTKFILPNQSVDFEVTFAPTESGVFRDTLYLSDTTCYSDMKLIVAGNSDGTSVSENEVDAIISPNPASDYIVVNVGANGHLPLHEDGLSGEIKIFDTFGNEMHPPRPSGTPQEGNKYRIDISTLPAGVYFVRIGSGVYKFLVVR